MNYATPKLRVAPSPTGKLHLGTARIALFNYLFALRNGGKLYLRIDDTDSKRNNTDTDAISDSFNYLGIKFDGLTHQSDHLDRYHHAIADLLANNYAYTGDDGAIYFRIPEDKIITWSDLIHGGITIDSNTLIGDKPFALTRANGTPLYHLASVVDDAAMGITHVIRGDDHITNTAKHILIAKALGYDLPYYGHVPLLLNADGKKLSKRDNTPSVDDLIVDAGYPSAAINAYLLSLGWNLPNGDLAGTNNDDLLGIVAAYFNLDDISPSPSRIDPTRLDRFSRDWINAYSDHDLTFVRGVAKNGSHAKNLIIARLIRDGATTFNDLSDRANRLRNTSRDNDSSRRLIDDEAAIKAMCHYETWIANLSRYYKLKVPADMMARDYYAWVKYTSKEADLKPSDFHKTLRALLTGSLTGYDAGLLHAYNISL